MDDELVTITISKSEALVLFDLLFEFRDENALSIHHDAERVVLWMLEASLEKTLAEPFSAEYDDIMQEARNRVIEKWGMPPRTPKSGNP